jgi:hypothetical protein
MARLGWIGTVMVLAVLVGCEKKKLPQEPPPIKNNPAPRQDTPKIQAPPTVPDSLAKKIEAEWPAIKAEGDKFMEKFHELEGLRAGGDRAKMQPVVEAARGHYEKALEMWNTIYYSVDDFDDAKAEACRRFMRQWNREVDKWTTNAKALKEFSQVK